MDSYKAQKISNEDYDTTNPQSRAEYKKSGKESDSSLSTIPVL